MRRGAQRVGANALWPLPEKKFFFARQRKLEFYGMETGKRKNLPVSESDVRLILGLKLKQLRAERGMSLSELSAATGISVSYLNEIEKGKKFPNPDKIAALASALEVSYDWLVSLKMSKKLAPVADILQSRIMKEILHDVFGIDKAQLLDLLSRVPVRLNAFINTLIEISRNYGMRVENFYYSALRSYQEMHENYFEDIENAASRFVKENKVDVYAPVEWEMLADILQRKYHYQIEHDGLANQPELKDFRSVLLPGRKPRLLLNKHLTRQQRAFVLGREIGFRFLNIQERPLTSAFLEVDSFEQVLNHFKASYFSCALVMNRERFVASMKHIFAQPAFDSQAIMALVDEFRVSPETFTHRLTNILPRYFGIQELFFLRFSHVNGTDDFELTKEMHLAGLHNPHANMLHEHYCRRWISINILRHLSMQMKKGVYSGPLCMAQRSRYFGNEKEYLIITFAHPAMDGVPLHNSISIGLLLTTQLKKKVAFWNDPSVPIRMVGETCQRCPAVDCAERVADPVVLQRAQKISVMKTALQALSDS